MCGTPLYVAPEVLRANGKHSYGFEVDVWSLGVILFVCLVGYLPFSAEYSGATLKDQIMSGRYRYAPTHWSNVSAGAYQLVRRMLTVRVDRRITLDGILQHSWMQDEDVIIRVDTLLNQAKTIKSLKCMTVSSASSTTSNEENSKVVITNAKPKRALSNSFSTCEPLPKKMRRALYPSEDNNHIKGS
ncbi:hypothetical protein EVAR_20542_1 [Eumeta japonica]|uniref:Protein kinase domain-containing protein n=1 Tax=Eumeta variegata TaxID=151549 RepID=A0A4C1VN37_EUMVA|nr:hypothetical protein EVAR_20542_1 [Eumeta japonica]